MFASEIFCRCRYSQHLGMGGDIMKRFSKIMGARNHSAVGYYYSADRYFALIVSKLRFRKRFLHKFLVCIHNKNSTFSKRDKITNKII
jgi:hypothetical protein